MKANKLVKSGHRKNTWIPLTRKLPKTDKSVLICTKRKEIQVAYRTPKEFAPGYEWYVFGTLGFSLTYQDDEVAAWRYLPRVYCGKENRV